MDAISTLAALLDRLTEHQHPDSFRRWVGTISDDWSSPPHEIVSRSGYAYPTYQQGGVDVTFWALSAAEAAELLAQISTQSLVDEFPRPPEPKLVEDIAQALAVLGDRAMFLTNRKGGTWHPLSLATFDVGLVGFNQECGFCLCFEEED